MKKKLLRIKKKLVSRAKKIYTAYFYLFYLPRLYRRAAQQPVNPRKVVFVRGREADIGDNFQLIYNRLKATRRFDLHVVGLGLGVRRYKTQIKLVKKAALEVATAAYVFTDDGNKLMGALPLRPETTLTNTWHACGAFKRFGIGNVDKKFGGDRRWWEMYHPYKYTNLLTVSSPYVVDVYTEAIGIKEHPDCVQPLGVSRTDVFFNEKYLEDAREAIEDVVPQAAGKKILLYAPTYRGRVANGKAPKKLDIRAFKEAFSDEYVLLIKHHPFVKKRPRIPVECRDFAFDVTRKLEINQLLCMADVCITDYSSVVFEYSLFERPILFFAFDKENYDDWRGFFFDYEEMTPGPVFRENEGMIDYIKGLPEAFDPTEILAFREKFMSSCDGHATDRIMKAVFGDTMTAKLSIIIPAYNAMPELTRALDTIKDQLNGRENIRVIVVDDGSDDGTGEEADRYAAEMPHVFKAIHLDKPSGSPSKPRNVGIDAALSKYVFFHDADDYLGDKALSKILKHIRKWNPDVMLVKFKGEDGRSVPTSMFKMSEEDVDVFESAVMRTLSPLKVIKRSFIDKHRLRFPENGMPEDIPFVLEAYVRAGKVSVAADYDYYHVAERDAGEHATLTTWDDLDGNFRVFEEVLRFIDDNVDVSRRDITLMPRLFNRDVENMLVSAVANHEGEERMRYLDRIIRMFSPYWSDAVGEGMSPEQRMVLESAFGEHGSSRVADALIASGERPLNACRFTTTHDGRMLCEFDYDDAHLCVDVTNTVPIHVVPMSVVSTSSAVELTGEVRILEQVARDFEDMSLSVVLKRLDETGELSVPVSFEVVANQDEESPKREFVREWEPRTLSWRVELPLSAFSEIDDNPGELKQSEQSDEPAVPVKILLFMRVQCGSFTRDIRTGTRASDRVREEWLGSRFEVDGVKWLPYCTKFGNFSWRHDEEA